MKYEFTGETKVEFGVTLKRIKRCDTGEVGGWIEKESNLSMDGSAWVSGEAQVFGSAWVSGEAQVFGSAWVSGEARVSGSAWVSGEAQVSGSAWVFGKARVSGSAWVSGEAQVSGSAWVSGEAQVFGSAWVSGEAQVSGSALVSGSARVSGEAQVFGKAQVSISPGCQYIFDGHYGMTVTETTVSVGCNIWSHAQVPGLSWEVVKGKITEKRFDRLKCLALILMRMIQEAKS